MNYIYDILLNFNEKLYEFYDWELNDEIIHIRKIPLIKISSKSLIDIRNHNIKVNDEFLNIIKKRTDIFSKKKSNEYDFTCLLSDGLDVVGIKFNKDGLSVAKTGLLIDEEVEVLEVTELISEWAIEYVMIDEIKNPILMTRNEVGIDEYIKSEVHGISNLEKLEYIYYECFNEIEKDPNKIKNKIITELSINWDSIAYKLYDFFKLTSINK